MVLLPSGFRSLLTASCILLIVDRTLMMQKMPKVIPNKDRNVRSLLERNSGNAILKLVQMIARLRIIPRMYALNVRINGVNLYQNVKTNSHVLHRKSTAQDQYPSERRRTAKHLPQRTPDGIYVERGPRLLGEAFAPAFHHCRHAKGEHLPV